jgi:hypothetical protein
MKHDELLLRIAKTLKQDIGPAVEAAYPKTQAFMSAVVLEKVARQLQLAPEHAIADHADIVALLTDLSRIAPKGFPLAIQEAISTLNARTDQTALSNLIEVLYVNKPALGEDLFNRMLSRIREVLRARVDRQMVYAA